MKFFGANAKAAVPHTLSWYGGVISESHWLITDPVTSQISDWVCVTQSHIMCRVLAQSHTVYMSFPCLNVDWSFTKDFYSVILLFNKHKPKGFIYESHDPVWFLCMVKIFKRQMQGQMQNSSVCVCVCIYLFIPLCVCVCKIHRYTQANNHSGINRYTHRCYI